jgi:uncharacterized protein (DUF1501 family)
MSRNTLSRRDFLRLSCCSATGAALATGMGRFGLVNAYAQTSGPYQALVCIFLFGGNDGNNMLIPFDTTGYTAYSTARGTAGVNGGLGLPQASLLPINAGPTSQIYSAFSLHPSMPGIQNLYNSGKVAFVANMGTLVTPTTKTQYQGHSVTIPSSLFSHSDQQNQAQTAAANSLGTSGWAGRVADKLNPTLNAGAQLPMIMSLAGSNIFATGLTTRPTTVTPTNPGFSNLDTTRSSIMQNLLTLDSGVSLVQAASAITGFAFADVNHLTQALQGAPGIATPVPPNNGLASQLKQVAQVIQVRNNLNISRQIFFCSAGGYDTHNFQLTDQGTLLSQLSAAMSFFYQATQELGVGSQVTTFTLSDFGRTLQPSSGAGTDHAWGNHQMVMGDAVHGGNIYGTFPSLVVGGPDDVNNANAGARGRWLPSTSLDQYAATLASWFGVAPSDLTGGPGTVFPDLANFSVKNLGFV